MTDDYLWALQAVTLWSLGSRKLLSPRQACWPLPGMWFNPHVAVGGAAHRTNLDEPKHCRVNMTVGACP
jgi:hypothetical protein